MKTITINDKTYSTQAVFEGQPVTLIQQFGNEIMFEQNGRKNIRPLEEFALTKFEVTFPIYIKYSNEYFFKLVSQANSVCVQTFAHSPKITGNAGNEWQGPDYQSTEFKEYLNDETLDSSEAEFIAAKEKAQKAIDAILEWEYNNLTAADEIANGDNEIKDAA